MNKNTLCLKLFFVVGSMFAMATSGCAASSTDATEDSDYTSGSLSAALETFDAADGQFGFHLKAKNGEIVLTSELYTSTSARDNGVASVKANGSRRANYQLREATNGQFYFVLNAANGEIIALSETYASKSNAERALERAAQLVTNIKISEAPRVARFETFVSENDGKSYFHLRAKNGEIVLQSEAYESAASAQKGIDSVKANGTDDRSFEIRESKDGQFYFVLKAANGEIVAVSEMFVTRANAERGVGTVVETLRGSSLDATVTAQ